MNPIINQLMGNNFLGLFKALKTAQNPNAMFQNMVQTNPQLQQVMNFINQNGGNAKQLFYQQAQQKSVDPNIIINNLKNLI